jgi:hypothetical protein
MTLSKRFPFLPGVCWGKWNGHACPISGRAHERGRLDAFGAIHYADREFTRRGARNLLLLVARRARQKDPAYLNDPMYDWLYVYLDSVRAQSIALEHGFRLPARLFDGQRTQARAMAARRSVSIRRYPRFKSWLEYVA